MGLIVISPLLRKRHPLLAELNTPPSDSLLSAALPEPCRGLPRNPQQSDNNNNNRTDNNNITNIFLE